MHVHVFRSLSAERRSGSPVTFTALVSVSPVLCVYCNLSSYGSRFVCLWLPRSDFVEIEKQFNPQSGAGDRCRRRAPLRWLALFNRLQSHAWETKTRSPFRFTLLPLSMLLSLLSVIAGLATSAYASSDEGVHTRESRMLPPTSKLAPPSRPLQWGDFNVSPSTWTQRATSEPTVTCRFCIRRTRTAGSSATGTPPFPNRTILVTLGTLPASFDT
jgi:hypothetical protein